MDHSKVSIEKFKSKTDILIEYMKQDIYLLGGVMKEVQDIYYKLYSVDITTKITLSSLSLTIFRNSTMIELHQYPFLIEQLMNH